MTAREQESCAQSTPRAERIALLNDTLRQTAEGGRIVVTSGVKALHGFEAGTLLKQVAAYDSFNSDNDPHGERDFGDLDYCGAELLCKIDYYDPSLQWGSSDPAEPYITVRVLTIMLAEEY
jgi:hypothetical protein